MKSDIPNNTVAILDAGAQYGKVIDRRVRELGVETQIVPLDASGDELEPFAAFIISGGPESVYGPNAPAFNRDIFEMGKPILGICYGLQLINFVYGGTVEKKMVREDGQFSIKVETDSPLFIGLEEKQQVLLTHGDTVDQIPEGFRIIADSTGLIAGVENTAKKLFGVQFHPEVDLTANGKKMLANFLFGVVGLEANFTLADRELQAIKMIRHTVKDDNVLMLLSGGVDSTVTAALVSKALKPEQIYAIHIDHGFMRQDESEKVIRALAHLGIKIHLVEAQQDFAQASTQIDGKTTLPLHRIIDPEHKRKIIGDTFIKVAEKVIGTLDLIADETFLVQGTLRPDLIESASKLASSKAQTIKTHHNDTALVRELRDRGRVIEPLQEYHKDEVRQLGQSLGLAHDLVWRQPFPGPGLAIRTLCATEPFTENYDQVYQQLHRYSSTEHALTLLPIKTVGVQGDGRSYSYAVGLTGSSDWAKLRELALEIPKHLHQVNRIVYIFGEKISEPIKEITPTYLTPVALDQLRQADEIVNQLLLEKDLTISITQVPVISVPVGFGKSLARSIVIRTFITNDFMTGTPAIPGEIMPEEVLHEMVQRILEEVPGISRVMYDLTAKPPGTTEWE